MATSATAALKSLCSLVASLSSTASEISDETGQLPAFPPFSLEKLSQQQVSGTSVMMSHHSPVHLFQHRYGLLNLALRQQESGTFRQSGISHCCKGALRNSCSTISWSTKQLLYLIVALTKSQPILPPTSKGLQQQGNLAQHRGQQKPSRNYTEEWMLEKQYIDQGGRWSNKN